MEKQKGRSDATKSTAAFTGASKSIVGPSEID